MTNRNGAAVKKLLFSVDIAVERDGDMYHAFIPALTGIHVEGETERQAVQFALEAAESYVEALIRRGEPIPLPVTSVALSGQAGTHEGLHKHSGDFVLALT